MNLDLNRSRWRRVQLGDLVRRSRLQVDPLAKGVRRYVAGGHIDGQSMTVTRWGDPSDGQMGSTFRYAFRPGQILFVSARPNLRKCGVVEFEGVVADKTYVLDAVPERGLLQDFLPFVLASEPFVAYAIKEATGSMNPRLLWGPFQRYEFDLPPLDEQQRIADLLWKVEAVCRANAELKEVVDKVVDRRMRVLSESGLGGTSAISDLLLSTIGGVWGQSPGNSDMEVRVVRGTDISVGGRVAWDQAPRRSISRSEAQARLLQSGDVLIEKSGGSPEQPVGKVGLVTDVEEDAVGSNFVLLARANVDLCLPEYLFMLLRGMWRSGGFAPYTGKTTNIANLRVRQLLASHVAVPDLKKQRELASQLALLNDAADAAAEGCAASHALRQTLLVDLLGGG